ncbi:hypothetical protein [Yersinia intermedia]|uniref:hypothetical protein n=1 Tax=Yersinia intermedia TaxID=631 RepID=UPI0022FF0D49|nr:hypothetical protein [Yersinia intermedia]MDA5514570.1 hypothetical protein [Yersinia intermedia]
MKAKHLLTKSYVSYIALILIIIISNTILWCGLIKYPAKVTADNVSASVAMSAFILALYSAYKVNKWLDSKVNEKGFKKCEDIIDTISIIKEKLVSTHPKIHITFNENKTCFINDDEYIHAIRNEKESVINNISVILDDIFTVLSLQNQLNVWSFKYSDDFYAKKLNELMVDMRNTIDDCYEYIESGVQADHQEFLEITEIFITDYYSALSLCNDFMKTKFDKIFIKLHHP